MVKGTPKENWRSEKPTEAQIKAIKNIGNGWDIPINQVKTKGQAYDEIQRLQKKIESKKSHSSYNDVWYDAWDAQDDADFRSAFDWGSQ